MLQTIETVLHIRTKLLGSMWSKTDFLCISPETSFTPPTSNTFNFTAEQIVSLDTNVVIQIAQPQLCTKNLPEKQVKAKSDFSKCVNCRGPHVANYRDCPAYKDQAFGQHVVQNRFPMHQS